MIPFVFIPIIGIILMYFLTILETYELGPPLGLKVLRFKGNMVQLGWTPRVFDDILDKKVIIKIWNEHIRREYTVNADEISAWIPFLPNSKNYVSIAFASETQEGEYSEVLEFRTSESSMNILSLLPKSFEVHQLGNSSVLLTWRKPETSIENLKGYIIEYNQNIPGSGEDTVLRFLKSEDDEVSHKISGLKHGFYNFHLRTRNAFGSSDVCTASIMVTPHISAKPEKANFTWEIVETERSELDFDEATFSSEIIVIDERSRSKKKVVKIKWLPNLNGGNPGDRFYVQYRPKGKKTFLPSAVEELETHISLDLPYQHKVYEVFLTTLDGGFSSDSDIQEVQMA